MNQLTKRGRIKIYIGMSAGVGKTYRMLQEMHTLLATGIDARIGYIETHGRRETAALLAGLPLIPLKSIYYKGSEIREMDLQAILNARPELVVVDELAHSNARGSRNEKRWQDVLVLLDNGIDVISAINIQHIESMNVQVKRITGVEVSERVPDRMLAMADEVVNIDLTADELIARLRAGKIYTADKISLALQHFFKPSNILQLRELALKEVAVQVERKVDIEMPPGIPVRHERLMACISSNAETAANVIRKTARLASYYNASWFVLYVQTPAESSSRMSTALERRLINHFKLAAELGATVIRRQSDSVVQAIAEEVGRRQVTTVCIGKPHFKLFRIILATGVFNGLLKQLTSSDIDLVILS